MRQIIGIAGRIGSGKDTAAKYLIDNHNFNKMAFADSLKDAVGVVFGWDRELLEGATPESRRWREAEDKWWSAKLGMTITPRWVLQQWGTEVLRHGFHGDIWIASMENRLLKNVDSNIVVTDCRFYNELEAIKRIGGKVYRIERGGEQEWYSYAKSYNTFHDTLSKHVLEDRYGIHASEYSSVGYNYDGIINNDGMLEDLYREMDRLVNS